jgi:hypothetical protein
MDTPTAALVRDWATTNAGESFDWDRFGYPAVAAGETDHLDGRVAVAVAWVESWTGRSLDASLTDTGLAALARDAVLMRLQQILVGRGTTRAVRDALSGSTVKSIRAGDYSQTNRDPVDARKAAQINPWGELSDVILALATPERREEILAGLDGKVRPVALSVEPTLGYPGESYLGV